MASPNPRPRNEDIRIAIICALNLEYDAVKLAFDMTWEGTRHDTQDGYCYCVGQIGGHLSLLVSCEPGKVNAATVTGSIQSTYTGIKLAIVAGICGGVPRIGTDQELRLGDVVISKSIFQYDYGRKNPDKFRPKEDIEDVLPMPGRQIRSFLSNLQQRDANLALQLETNRILQLVQRQEVEKYDIPKYGRPDEEEDYLYEADYVHRHRDSRQCDCKESGACDEARDASCEELGCEDSGRVPRPRKRQKLQDGNSSSLDVSPQVRVRFGRFGSGDTVMKSGRDRDTIASQHGLMAFEMEGAGVRSHIHDSIIVKAVCDYADSHKNKSWQNFSAAVAASATKAVLESFSCEPKIPCTSQLVEFGGNPQLATQTGVESRTDSFIAGHSKGEYDEIESKLLPLLAAEHERYKNFNPPRVKGTCEWFLKDRRFREWLESSSGIIWVSAGPGCGKSVLARSLIDEDMLSINPEKTTVCHFFFKDGQERRTSSSDALSAILHQLFDPKRANGLVRHARNPFKSHEEKLRNNFYQLWEILVNCAEDPNAGEIVCVLDALDECNERCGKEILQVLKTFYFGKKAQSSSRLKFIITSRPYDHLEYEFLKFSDGGSYVRLDGDEKSADIGAEINLVIDYRVNEIAENFSAKHHQQLLKHLKDMNQRTYLWLHLTMGIINENRSAYGKYSKIEKLLRDLPSSVTEAYEKILSRSSSELDAKCLLQIVLAAKHPLTLDEVNHCFALQEEWFTNNGSHSYEDLEAELWTRKTVKSTIRNLSGLFLSVCDDKVSFIHKTARDFLIAEPGSLTTAWKGKFRLPSAHNLMFVSCFRFLSLQDFDTLVKANKAPPFMAYAASNWVDHYNSQDEIDRDKVHQDARELCRIPERRGRPSWLETKTEHGRLLPWGPWGDVNDWTDLILASFLGLLEVVVHLLDREKTDANQQNRSFGTAVLAASQRGHARLVQTLWEHGADCNTGNHHHGTALLAAIYYGHVEVADYLLSGRTGAHSTQDVFEAATDSHYFSKELMSLVLDKCPEVEITKEMLLYVIRRDKLETLRLLLERHQNLVRPTPEVIKYIAEWALSDMLTLLQEFYGNEVKITPEVIQAAAGSFRGKGMLSFLLDRHEDKVEPMSAVVRAALQSSKGHEILALLLERFASTIKFTLDDIQAAASNEYCSREIVNLLLEKGFIVAGNVELVLITAVTSWKGKETVALLLKKCGDWFKITPSVFRLAARYSKPETIALLLEQRGYEIKVTQDDVIALAMNPNAYIDTMELLLEKGGEEVEITQEFLLAAAANGSDSIMDFLLERYDNKVQVTQEVILARATNCWGDEDGMASILEKGGEEVRITQDLLLTAASQGSELTVGFLLEEHGDKVKVTRDVIKAGRRNGLSGEEIITLISKRYGHTKEIKAWLSEEWDSDEENSDEKNSDEKKYNAREHDEDGNEERDGNAETTEDR